MGLDNDKCVNELSRTARYAGKLPAEESRNTLEEGHRAEGIRAAVGWGREGGRQGPLLWGPEHREASGFCSKHRRSCWWVVSLWWVVSRAVTGRNPPFRETAL